MSLKHEKTRFEEPHPAAVWAESVAFDALQIDCIIALTLKILDRKSQMNLEEQLAIMVIYHAVKSRKGLLFDNMVHQVIEQAQQVSSPKIDRQIHDLWLYAENMLPTPVLDYFELFVRESLFGV